MRLPALDKLIPIGFLLGIVGLGAWALGLQQDKLPALQGYFFAWVFWLCMTLGCFVLVLLAHTLRSTWGLAILRLIESGAKLIPVMLLLYLPILLMGMHDIYPWSNPAVVAADKVLQHKSVYLNTSFFLVRLILFFGCWWLMATVLNKLSQKQDATQDWDLAQKRTNIAAPGILFFAITVTFGITDWIMSTDPHWFSTIYAVWFVVGQGLAVASFTTFIITLNCTRKPYCDIVNPKLTRDLGNLMFMFTMLWAYTSLSQYLIIWYGNLPEENTFYLNHTNGGFSAMGAFVVIAQFFIPFVLLLSPKVKRVPAMLCKMAAWIFVIRIIDVYWVVMPTFCTHGPRFLWTDAAAFVGVGGLWLALFAWNLKGKAVLPTFDTRLMEADHA